MQHEGIPIGLGINKGCCAVAEEEGRRGGGEGGGQERGVDKARRGSLVGHCATR